MINFWINNNLIFSQLKNFIISDYEILYYIGSCHYELNNYSTSIRFFKKSLIINHQNQYTVYALGKAYIQSDNKRDAKRQLKNLMNLDNSLFELLKIAFNDKFGS